MIKLEFKINEKEVENFLTVNVETVTDTDLDFYLLRGDVEFQVGSRILDEDCKWVPVLNFATQLFDITSDLICKVESKRLLEFPESEATIRFERDGENLVSIAPDYDDKFSSVSVSELHAASRKFLKRVLDAAIHLRPIITKNPYFASRMRLLDCND